MGATLLNPFACIEEIDKMQRSEGSDSETALKNQSAIASMSTREAAPSDGRSAAIAVGVDTRMYTDTSIDARSMPAIDKSGY